MDVYPAVWERLIDKTYFPEAISMTQLLIAVICLAAVNSYVTIPWLYGGWQRRRLATKALISRVIVLTFDDGPGNRLTPKILKILSEQKLKASFFLLGRNIGGREEIVRRIVAEGHDMCSHGFNHLHAWKVWPWQSIRDIKKGWQAIDRALGTCKGIYPFRPPYGKLNLVTLLYLWSKGVPIIFWTADIGDTWAEERIRNRLSREWTRIQKGAVVLAHDFDRASSSVDDYVMEAVQRCIITAQESQLKICSLSELGIATE